jgi:cell division protein FtsI (penicillin-binding protein 3)
MWVEPTGYQPGASGRDVQISIDLVIQQIVERRLTEAVTKRNAGGGRAVVIDCLTGEILALPDVLQERDGWESTARDPGRDIHPGLARNRCVTEPYEPGSTFKPFVWAAATEMGLARPEDVLPTPATPAYRTSQGRRIRDSTYVENATWRVVLQKSINSGMSMVAERMSHRQMQGVVERFGFGRRTRCGVPGESIGIVTTPDDWSHYTQTSVSMGHEIAVTAVQMARGFSVFARDGTLPVLRLTKAAPDEDTFSYVNRVVSPQVVLTARDVMRDVVEKSAHDIQSERYQIFGKSGTAQLPKREGGGYHEDRYVSSFVGGAPFDEPRLVVLCVIDDPDRKLGHFGSAVAGPVVRDIMDETLTYLGVAPDRPPHPIQPSD